MSEEIDKARMAHDKIPTGYQLASFKSGNKLQRFWNYHKFTKIAPYLPKKGRILDIGCGSGVLGHLKNDLGIGDVEYFGLDISKKQIEFARKTQPKNNFVVGDCLEMPFPDNHFDGAVMIEFIEHFPETKINTLFNEVRRILKPKGKIIITTPNYRSPYPLVEFLLSKIGKVNYCEQHITHFSPKKIKKVLQKNSIVPEKVFTSFGFAPFLSIISNKIALKMLRREDSFLFGFGLKLFCVGRND